MRARLISLLGSILSRYGIAGFVREGRYIGQTSGVTVNVRRSGLHSVVSVNAVDVHFHRVTGEIECVKRQKEIETLGIVVAVPADSGVQLELSLPLETTLTPSTRPN